MKALSILGLIFSALFLLFFAAFISSNGISKDEFAPVGIIFGLWCIAFSIVATVSAFRKQN